MSLTNSEQRRLNEIERTLTKESPRLARMLAGDGWYGMNADPRQWHWVIPIGGLVLYFAGLATEFRFVAVFGALVFAVYLAIAYTRSLLMQRHSRPARWPTTAHDH